MTCAIQSQTYELPLRLAQAAETSTRDLPLICRGVAFRSDLSGIQKGQISEATVTRPTRKAKALFSARELGGGCQRSQRDGFTTEARRGMEEVMVVKGNGWRCESRLLGFAPRRFCLMPPRVNRTKAVRFKPGIVFHIARDVKASSFGPGDHEEEE